MESFLFSCSRLYSLIPVNHCERDSIMMDTIKWSKVAEGSHGHPRLHQMFAYSFWNAKRYAESRHHFLHSVDGSGCGQMLADFHSAHGFSREVDLFIASTVLQLICLRKHIVAALTLQAYTEKHPSIQK